MSKWYLNDLDILKYEEDEVASKNLAENGEDEIRDLNRRINCLKIEERKSRRGDKKNLEEKMNKLQKRRRKRSDNSSVISRTNLKFM